MKEIPLTLGQVALVDDADWPYLSQFKWHAVRGGKNFYALRNTQVHGGVKGWRPVRMHRVIMGAIKGQKIDHRNGNGCDNQRGNLRLATGAQNMANQVTLCVRNTSGRRGVSWDRARKRWQVAVSDHGRRIPLGRFKDLDEAARAYDAAALKLYGEFARPNFAPEYERAG
jgi:hypothetical protein